MTIVNKVFISILLLLVGSDSLLGNTTGNLLTRLEEVRIQKETKNVAAMLASRRWKKNVAVGAMITIPLMMVTFSAYSFYLSNSGSRTKSDPVVQRSLLQILSEWETWKNLGIECVKYFGMTCVANAAYKFLEDYVDQSVLAWYVSVVTPFDRTLNGMYEHAEKLARAELESDKDFYYKSLRIDHALLVRQITQVLAFMECKSRSMNSVRAGHARALVRHTVATINRMTGELESGIIKRYDGLTRIITDIDVELQRKCAHFARLEGSPWIGPNDVQSMMLTHVLR